MSCYARKPALQCFRALCAIWMGGRVVECSGLENRRRVTFRGFESHPIRYFYFAARGVPV